MSIDETRFLAAMAHINPSAGSRRAGAAAIRTAIEQIWDVYLRMKGEEQRQGLLCDEPDSAAKTSATLGSKGVGVSIRSKLSLWLEMARQEQASSVSRVDWVATFQRALNGLPHETCDDPFVSPHSEEIKCELPPGHAGDHKNGRWSWRLKSSEEPSAELPILDRKVTVCAACLCASCWQGEFCCDNHKTAGMVEKTIRECEKPRGHADDHLCRWPAQMRDDWLPIGTVPDPQTYPVLGAVPRGDVGDYAVGEMHQTEVGWYWAGNDPSDSWGGQIYPAYWQPLPEPPSSAVKASDPQKATGEA